MIYYYLPTYLQRVVDVTAQCLFLTYPALLLYLTFSTPIQRCIFLRLLDSHHTCLPPQEHDHVSDCNLNYRSVYYVMDHFVVAHLIGWFIKGMIVPDIWLLWTGSIAFELVEWALSGFIPTFKECWWDSWLLDAILCNGTGIAIALQSSAWMKTRFKHVVVASISKWNNTVRVVVGLAMLFTDLNGFLLKQLLDVQSSSTLVVNRLLLYVICAIATLPKLGKTKAQLISLFPTLYLTMLFLELAILPYLSHAV